MKYIDKTFVNFLNRKMLPFFIVILFYFIYR